MSKIAFKVDEEERLKKTAGESHERNPMRPPKKAQKDSCLVVLAEDTLEKAAKVCK